ncbi:hypothetical protein RIR_jg37479.t1 [Rhizophagus irregularis DAOM 181602=DAOM 197198]|nr:hypothetical protein RIR_jg37479.t1 [Rhizophagus irregularis DAOM 181602=DAOM 197198]
MDSLRSVKIPIIQLQKSILPYNFDSEEQPETEQPATDKQEPLVLIISPSVTSDDGSSGSPSVGDHGQDDQIFVQPKKMIKKRTKIDTSMRKRAKPDEKILLAINKIGASDLSFEANIIELKKFKELDMVNLQ